MERATLTFSQKCRRVLIRAAIAVVLALAVILPAGSPFVGRTLAYTCTVYAYAPVDYGPYALAQGEAYCPAGYEYKTLTVCLVKSGVGTIECRYDPGYQTYYYAATPDCYGSGYYYTAVTFTNQGTRYSNSVYITC